MEAGRAGFEWKGVDGMTPNNNVRFTALGIAALVFLTIVLAAGDKTGRFVIYVLGALILLVVLVNYKNVLNLFFTGVNA